MFFFDGDSCEMSQAGASFEQLLKTEIEKKLGQLFHKFSQGHISITESDYKQLLEKDTSGLGTVFFDEQGGLGIAQNDAGRIIFKCVGQVPREIFHYLEERTYLTGEQLIKYFGEAPFGYSSIVIKSSIIGLLREERLRIIDSKHEITSIQDPGAKSIFEKNREFLCSEIEINKETTLTGRDRTGLRRFFEDSLGLSHVDSESDKLADLVFKHFPEWKDKISELTNKLGSLNFSIPEELNAFNKALTSCLENRQVLKTLERFKRNLDLIKKGVSRVKELEEILNENTEKELRQLKSILEVQVKQLEQVGEESNVKQAVVSLENHMKSESPWRAYADLKPMAEKIQMHYKQTRKLYKQKQQDELDNQLSQIKLRPDFADLEIDKQQDVLQSIRKVFLDVDEDAVQPGLLLIKQAPDRIRDATSEAHRLIDNILNEQDADDNETEFPPAKVEVIKLDLLNRIISNQKELEQRLSSLKEKCLKN
ncbi:MAG: hypothetical protein OMM_07627 [Candidatus Magnetoglobus multicellularis str. Araruama]|uniref:Uncharacterized protein n=1 Tax=Candidatus Magnetoglobus multicellularis str. Araruama TaxID=890399 RepID=A0A1V1PBD9_9BACT|nr:MAG: hypothetical protein OMM_07627 [Candidatus Magnetoglobus multicellularis str. Araruama]